jgi:TIR domain
MARSRLNCCCSAWRPVLALENLLGRCAQEKKTAIVFIATAQTPGELVYGGALGTYGPPALVDSPLKYEKFDQINDNYRLRFRNLVSSFVKRSGNILIERHIFARKKDKKFKAFSGRYKALNNFLEVIPQNPINGLIETKKVEAFETWIKENHKCKLPGRSTDSPEDMARIQWFNQPENNGLNWDPNFICTDLIVFGSAADQELADYDRAPDFMDIEIDWEFGLQSIDLGVQAEGRVVKPLYKDELEHRINFLGFTCCTLDSFIRCLQTRVEGVSNYLGLEVSSRVVDEEPWSSLWRARNSSSAPAPVAKPRPANLVREMPPAAVIQDKASFEIFISYSHRDHRLLEELKTYLVPLERSGLIFWSDPDIRGGNNFSEVIDEKLNTAKIILLLVSADFLKSNYCYSIEMTRALERHELKEARVVPIILRPSDWKNTPLSKLQVLPSNGKPLKNWANRENAYQHIVEEIRAIVAEIKASSGGIKA